ncbi:Acetyl-coenzyme A synthetase [Hordeum vulgare]|nr:Acetyl-coenzyme A synthetase [Hordeum vulgare]KAI5020204.1 hypothetical protein ZWY2020_045092 [Hordeum vulgare]
MAPSPRRRRHLPLLLPLLLLVDALWGAAPSAGVAELCKVWLLQSIPTDMPHLRRLPGVLSTVTGNQYQEMYQWSIDDPTGFWSEIAETFYWK